MRFFTLLALCLVAGACSAKHPTGPSPTVPPPVQPVFRLEGSNGDLCVPEEHFYRSWTLTVTDAGDAGMTARAVRRSNGSAACQPPFTSDTGDLFAYGIPTFAPRAAGSVSFILGGHPSCGSTQYELWNGDTRIGLTRVTTGHDC